MAAWVKSGSAGSRGGSSRSKIHAAASVKQADYRPQLVCHLDRRTHREPFELPAGSDTDHDFVQAPFEHAALDDVEILVHNGCHSRDTTYRNVGIGKRRFLLDVDDHEQFGRRYGAFIIARAVWSLGVKAGLVSGQPAHHL